MTERVWMLLPHQVLNMRDHLTEKGSWDGFDVSESVYGPLTKQKFNQFVTDVTRDPMGTRISLLTTTFGATFCENCRKKAKRGCDNDPYLKAQEYRNAAGLGWTKRIINETLEQARKRGFVCGEDTLPAAELIPQLARK